MMDAAVTGPFSAQATACSHLGQFLASLRGRERWKGDEALSIRDFIREMAGLGAALSLGLNPLADLNVDEPPAARALLCDLIGNALLARLDHLRATAQGGSDPLPALCLSVARCCTALLDRPRRQIHYLPLADLVRCRFAPAILGAPVPGGPGCLLVIASESIHHPRPQGFIACKDQPLGETSPLGVLTERMLLDYRAPTAPGGVVLVGVGSEGIYGMEERTASLAHGVGPWFQHTCGDGPPWQMAAAAGLWSGWRKPGAQEGVPQGTQGAPVS